MEENKNNSKNIIIAILIIIILGLGGFIVYDKLIDKNVSTNTNKEVIDNNTNNEVIDNNDENEEDENKTDNNNSNNFTFKTFELRCNLECLERDTQKSYTEDINGFAFKVEEVNQEIKLYLNNKLIYSWLDIPSQILMINNEVIMFYHGSTDVMGNRLLAFDKNGNKLLDVQYLDNNKKGMFVASGVNFTVKDNKIMINGNRISHGPSIYLTNGGSSVDISTKEKIEAYKNEVSEGIYYIEYLGNNKFSEIKNIEYKTVYSSGLYDSIITSEG